MIAAIALLLASAAPDLGWLSGCWEEQKGDGFTEECWTVQRGGQLMGSNRSGKRDQVTAFEFMRIAPAGDGTPVFWASPGGAAPVSFRLVRSNATEAVFENPTNDFPTTIRYWRDGEALRASVTGKDRANALSWRFERK